MDIQLEPDLELLEKQPHCVKSTRFTSGNNGFTITEDERGQAFIFKRLELPAVSIEVIRTLAGKVRGNHVHEDCTETMHVVSGEINLYLLCEHGKHVFMQALKAGETIITPQGTPHALYSVQDSECVVLFDKDPTNDRAGVPIVQF